MPQLDDHFMTSTPIRHRVRILETDEDLRHFRWSTATYPDSKGMYQREHPNGDRDSILLKGAVFVEMLDETGERVRFDVLTRNEFRERFTAYRHPTTEYGIQWLPDPEQVVPHPTLERCREVLDGIPALKHSGEYVIVTRQGPSAPGPWVQVKDQP